MNRQSTKIHRSINIIFLFVILGLLAYIGTKEGIDDDDYYIKEKQYDINPLSVEQVEITVELRELFPEYVLDETYRKKVMYALEVEIINEDCEGLNSYEYDSIKVEGSDGKLHESEMPEYYASLEDDPYCEMIPPYFTTKTTFYVVMDEDEIPEQLYIYKNYGEEEYVAIDMP